MGFESPRARGGMVFWMAITAVEVGSVVIFNGSMEVDRGGGASYTGRKKDYVTETAQRREL
jgi:hypothetical protein